MTQRGRVVELVGGPAHGRKWPRERADAVLLVPVVTDPRGYPPETGIARYRKDVDAFTYTYDGMEDR